MPPADNRAVSALFRVFGGPEATFVADDRALADCRGMHRGECVAFAILVPLTVLVAAGTAAGWLLAIPLGFLALNFLPLALGVKSQSVQWWFWLTACVLWAVFHRADAGVAGALAHVWIGIAVMNTSAALMLALKHSNPFRGVTFILLHGIAVWIGFHWGWPWALAAGAGIAGAFCWAVVNPYCQWLGPVTTKSDRGILITIDDGPDPHDTPMLLDLLDHHRTKAVFFMIGEKVRAHPDLACEVLRRGHEIGNHTLTHPQASFWCAGPWRTRREILGCQEIIRETTGFTPRWFRAPVGHRNLFTHPVAARLGLEVVAWSRRGFDAVEENADKVLGRILPDLAAGDIVLVHESTPISVEVLEKLLGKVAPHRD